MVIFLQYFLRVLFKEYMVLQLHVSQYDGLPTYFVGRHARFHRDLSKPWRYEVCSVASFISPGSTEFAAKLRAPTNAIDIADPSY